jgi:DNA-binding HxlR family transcriptional regulator
MSSKDKFKCHAAVQTTLTVIGNKWKPLILWHLLEGTRRFGELEKSLKPISQKILASELRALAADGIIHREIYRQVPPKVEYWITPYGLSLRPVLENLAKWGQAHQLKSKPTKTAAKISK